MVTEIDKYNQNQPDDRRVICEELAEQIRHGLPDNPSKLWHGHPVWFDDGNPIVGYAVRKHNVSLLFWSGQSFDEKGLTAEGTFKAAEMKYTDVDQINVPDLQRWLKKSLLIQWDYKNIVKRRGVLERLK